MARTKATATKTTTTNQTTAAAVANKVVAAKKDEVKPVETVSVTKEDAKQEVTKTAEQKAAKKTGKRGPKPAAKKPGRKPAKKPVEKIQEIFIEYDNEQFKTESIVELIHEKYRAEGHRVGAIKSLRVYIDPVARKAYYVINDNAEGKYVEF